MNKPHERLTRSTFSLPLGEVHALVGGAVNARPLLFLHGFPDHPPTAVPFLEHLAETHRVVAPWLRGYAPSPIVGPYPPHTPPADALALIDRERGRQKYLEEGMIPFGLTHFFFERCDVFAQRVDNALVSLFSLARALQLPRIKRLSEGDPDFPETRQDSADWQGLVCSRDEHRYDRDRETGKHDTDSRLEWLKLARARKAALGEPDNAQVTLQQYGAECETGDRTALGVDRHGIGQTADEPRKHIARYDDAPSSPVSSRQARITQNSAKGGRIKIAGVIRREYKLGVFR